MDNCRVHHSIKAQTFIRENNIDVIFNVPYGPEYNPIERVWAEIKLQFKKRRPEAILSGEIPDFEKLLRAVLKKYISAAIGELVRKTTLSSLM